MRSNPLVSVVIIFYNAERFIREAIESVFAQSYTDWELLLVDDGSTDGSTGIAREYEQLYPDKVRYHDHEGHRNRGMSASRNLGVKRASGRYVAMLDADDVWLANKLTDQVQLLNSNPEAEMICGQTQYWYSWTGFPDDFFRDHKSTMGIQSDTLVPPLTCLTLHLMGEITPFSNDIIISRAAYNDVGGFEEIFTGHYEERAFFIKFSLKHPVFVTGKCWSKYRQHPDSSSATVVKSGQKDAFRQFYLNWVVRYLTDQKVRDTLVWMLICRMMAPYLSPTLSRLVRAIKKQLQMYPKTGNYAAEYMDGESVETLQLREINMYRPYGK